MITGIEMPLELAALLCALCAAVGAWLGQTRARRRVALPVEPLREPAADPLRDLMKREALAEAINLAARRDAMRDGSHAVLRGRIDQLAALRTIWNAQTRQEVSEHVAAVMRAGLRRDDRITLAEGDGFTILVPGADERAAVRIADRMRRSLAQLRLPQLGTEARITASFGVAADRFGETGEGIVQRARRALEQAVAHGEDHVVPASEIEEIMLLPAPSPSPSASAA